MFAVKSGSLLAAASRIHSIPRRTLRGWVSREKSPLKKLGRNAVLPADSEKQLHPKIMRLHQVGFELTPNHVLRFAGQICKKYSMSNPWKGRMVGKVWFVL
jgi:hypothetical protein